MSDVLESSSRDDMSSLIDAYGLLFKEHIQQPCQNSPHFMRTYISLAETMLDKVVEIGRSSIDQAVKDAAAAFVHRFEKIDMPPQIRFYEVLLTSEIAKYRLPGIWESLAPEQRQGILDNEEDLKKLKNKYPVGRV